MNKIVIIFKREYLTRVTRKSFLVLTLLMPVLLAGLLFLPSYLATRESKEALKVAVIDRSMIFLGRLENASSTVFQFVPEEEYNSIKQNLQNSGYYAMLEIPQNILLTNKVLVYSHKQISIEVKQHIDSQLEKRIEEQKLAELVKRIGIPDLEEQMQKTRTNISVETIRMGAEGGTGKKGSTEIAMGVGYGAGFLIYMFVFIYGNMVMRGVLEEKQNRIVEIIISSAKPIQLMMGKILGLAAVGLTQFLIWIILMSGIFIGAKSLFIKEDTMQKMISQQTESIMISPNNQAMTMIENIEPSEMEKIFQQIEGINFAQIILSFLIYFILGYLLYSSLMAAVAAAVDSEEDMNQLMLPITIPLILAMVMLVSVIKNPEGPLAVWGSHIPFTSPIIMMVRIPFGVPLWEILISMGILALSTYGAIWMAAKIYRTGILMYGKKITWKEMIKWLGYKN